MPSKTVARMMVSRRLLSMSASSSLPVPGLGRVVLGGLLVVFELGDLIQLGVVAVFRHKLAPNGRRNRGGNLGDVPGGDVAVFTSVLVDGCFKVNSHILIPFAVTGATLK